MCALVKAYLCVYAFLRQGIVILLQVLPLCRKAGSVFYIPNRLGINGLDFSPAV